MRSSMADSEHQIRQPKREFGTSLNHNLKVPRATEKDSTQKPMPALVPRPENNVPEEYSRSDLADPQMVAQYINDVTEHQRGIEASFMSHKYLDDGTQPKGSMSRGTRSSVVNWIAEVHHKFRLKQETLPLAVNILDRFLSTRAVAKPKLQLVGATSLLIASKWVDIYPPRVRDLDGVAAGNFEKGDVIKMEMSILNAIKFDLAAPTMFHFVERFLKASGEDPKLASLVWYLTEAALTDYELVTSYKPSALAAACTLLGRRMLGKGPWHQTLVNVSGYSEDSSGQCVCDVVEVVDTFKVSKIGGSSFFTHKKYSDSEKHFNVAACNLTLVA